MEVINSIVSMTKAYIKPTNGQESQSSAPASAAVFKTVPTKDVVTSQPKEAIEKKQAKTNFDKKKDVANELAKKIKWSNVNIQVDERIDRYVIFVHDKTTGEKIAQIPNKDIVEMIVKLEELQDDLQKKGGSNSKGLIMDQIG